MNSQLTRRNLLKNTAILSGGIFVGAPLVNFEEIAHAGIFSGTLNAILGGIVSAVTSAGIKYFTSEVSDISISRSGKVALENVTIMNNSINLGNFYVGERVKIQGNQTMVGMDPYSIANLGGSAGRQIKKIRHVGRKVVVNNDIFDVWKSQGIDVQEYRFEDKQYSFQPDIYPASYSTMNRLNIRKSNKAKRCTVCKQVVNREPIQQTAFFDKDVQVYGFSEIVNSKGAELKHIWMNPTSGYREIVNREIVTANRYRTYSYKKNNPFPGSWAYAIAINDVVEEIIGFQWMNNQLFV